MWHSEKKGLTVGEVKFTHFLHAASKISRELLSPGCLKVPAMDSCNYTLFTSIREALCDLLISQHCVYALGLMVYVTSARSQPGYIFTCAD